MFALKILFIDLIFLINQKNIAYGFARIDCKDKALSQQCSCYYEDEPTSGRNLQMICNNLLTGTTNKLPDIVGDTFTANQVYSSWPSVPSSYQSSIYLDLSYGTITEISNVNNLMNLTTLILINNAITSITPDICKLKYLNTLDLSSNGLAAFNFENLICNPSNYSSTGFMSSLQYLILFNNRIKNLYGMDMIFFGFPHLKVLALKSNPLADLSIPYLSNKTIRFVNELKNNFLYFPNYFTPKPQSYFDFTFCGLTHIKLNFQLVYKKLLELNIAQTWIDNVLLKFVAFDFQGNFINCDCDYFDDAYFLVASGFFNGSAHFNNITNSSMGQNICIYKNLGYNIIKNVKGNI